MGKYLDAIQQLESADQREILAEMGYIPEETIEADPWEQPIPFTDSDKEPFPVDVLPVWLRDYVVGLAIQLQVPLELPALLSLAVIALSASRRYKIQPRAGWTEPLNLYVMTVLEPGNRKSGTMAELLAPVHDFEIKLIEEVKPAWERAKHELDCKKAALEDLKKQLVRARNGSKPSKEQHSSTKLPAEIQNDMDILIQEVSDFEEVFLPTILADDVTMEKLVILLSENSGSLGVFSAEATLFGIAAGRYSGNPNFDDLLKAHAGDPIKSDRIGRSRVNVLEPSLTIGASVQPIVLKELANTPSFRLKGLQARFLFAIPESPLGSRDTNAPAISESVRVMYHNGIRRLLKEALLKDKGRQTLQLSEPAMALLSEFEGWLEPQLGPNGSLRGIVDWAAKLTGALIRIAGNLHVAEHALNEDIPLTVEAETMSKAISLYGFLTTHAKAAFDMMDAESEEVTACKRVLRWIGDQDLTEFSKRDAFRALQGTFKKVEYMDPVLRTLCEHNFIREDENTKAGPGRKAQIFKVNPLMTKLTEMTESHHHGNIVNFVNSVPKDADSKITPIFWSELGEEVDRSDLKRGGF